MPDQKISQLTAIVTVDNSTDVLPIVDISANTTKKVTPTQLKTALALDNVNNTSDANKPVSIAQQDALNAKVSSNAAITAGTAPKITFDAKGLVTSGDLLDETDLPTGINANKIGTGVVSTTEFEYLNGVTSAIQTQINSKQATLVSGTNIKTVNSTSLLGSGDVAVQPTLVSGTNIKTINSTSILGSGDITIAANPSGVAGAIQFSNGSAFASDAANLFWDNVNKRWGVGTNAPTAILQAQNSTSGVLLARFKDANAVTSYIDIKNDATLNEYTGIYWGTEYRILSKAGNPMIFNCSNGINFADGFLTKMVVTPSEVQIGSISGARLGIKGSGSTSATTSLLVQNSAGTEAFRIKDDLSTTFQGNVISSSNTNIVDFSGYSYWRLINGVSGTIMICQSNTVRLNNKMIVGTIASDAVASAQFQIDSTTTGFLPPRMTTTQKNAIATPAAGLVVYDLTTNKLCCYNGSTWNDLF